MSADDLSGEWRGIFNYPRGNPPTAFTAFLNDADGALSGHTVEPNLHGGSAIAARLDGRRSGTAVTFVKLYEDNDVAYDTVAYDGSVDPDGREIAGRWTIAGVWSGTFIMVREREADVGAVSRVAETVPPS
ncbi:hypothetical protein [Sphingomonas sp.]|uniref:hypothetical protein n=1 Tax=Sphingomonas sp. TaxID=28214 RepID=UPI003AFF6958